MKRICVLILLGLICLRAFAQTKLDAFVGTWSYQNNDTIFRIKLQKGVVTSKGKYKRISLFGGYYLCVKGVVKENYIKTMPETWDIYTAAPSCNIYIQASGGIPNHIGFSFYDQRKKHINGKGLPCGAMKLIAPNKLHWTMNEKDALWALLEGSDEDLTLRGFSVPSDVIMTKE